MRLGRQSLSRLLMTNAVELRFRRRHKKPGYKDFRRMLCTNDRALLLSTPGKRILHFVPTHDHLKYDPASKNLIVAWDIFLQNWRMINCDDVDVVAMIKTSPDSLEFWNYFNDQLVKMSARHKANFMNT